MHCTLRHTTSRYTEPFSEFQIRLECSEEYLKKQVLKRIRFENPWCVDGKIEISTRVRACFKYHVSITKTVKNDPK